MSSDADEVLARARAWAKADPDPKTRAELEALITAQDTQRLGELFASPLRFGTAGLRAELGPGPARMNALVVVSTTAALAEHLKGQQALHAGSSWPTGGPGKDISVVVGHDARHGSAEFALWAARTVASAGLTALHFPSALPTPLTAFAVRKLGASAGIMVTASHNPARDNGYKVYMADGAQVIAPHDEAIERLRDRQAPGCREASTGSDGVVELDEQSLVSEYTGAVSRVLGAVAPRELKCAYTPLHGVGGNVLPAMMQELGFGRPVVVAEQFEPDPQFPTAKYPNPELPGTLDLVLALAASTGAELVLANDPDADRLAVALPDPSTDSYRALSGDELGVLIADHLIRTTAGDNRMVATTVVSSSMLGKLAAARNVAYQETLTGFKWLARSAMGHPGYRLLLAYEEALGYAVSQEVADKDGISAAMVVAQMVVEAKDQGRTLLSRLDELSMELGAHMTRQLSVTFAGPSPMAAMARVVARLADDPPTQLAGQQLELVRDLSKPGTGLPPSPVLVLNFTGGARVVLRPSGTEPKLKVYLEVATGPCGRNDLQPARQAARRLLTALGSDLAKLNASMVGQP